MVHGARGLPTATVQRHVTAALRHGAGLVRRALVTNCVREPSHSSGAATRSAAQVVLHILALKTYCIVWYHV